MRDTIFLSLARKVVYISSIAVFGTIASIVMYATFAAFSGPSSGPSVANHSRGLLYDYMFGAATNSGAVQQGSAWNFVPSSVTAALSGTINEKLNYLLQNGGSGGGTSIITGGTGSVSANVIPLAGGTVLPGNYLTVGGNPYYCRSVTVTASGTQAWSAINEGSTCDSGKICQVGNCVSYTPPVSASGSTQYPGCNTPDITMPDGSVWAACNVGTTNSGQVGSFYVWGRNTPVAESDTTTLPNTSGWSLNDKGPCATGYHIPAPSQFANAISAWRGTDTSTTSYHEKFIERLFETATWTVYGRAPNVDYAPQTPGIGYTLLGINNSPYGMPHTWSDPDQSIKLYHANKHIGVHSSNFYFPFSRLSNIEVQKIKEWNQVWASMQSAKYSGFIESPSINTMWTTNTPTWGLANAYRPAGANSCYKLPDNTQNSFPLRPYSYSWWDSAQNWYSSTWDNSLLRFVMGPSYSHIIPIDYKFVLRQFLPANPTVPWATVWDAESNYRKMFKSLEANYWSVVNTTIPQVSFWNVYCQTNGYPQFTDWIWYYSVGLIYHTDTQYIVRNSSKYEEVVSKNLPVRCVRD